MPVGKWVKIFGCGVSEEDNSQEIAMNKAGVTVEYIGNSGGTSEVWQDVLQREVPILRWKRWLPGHRTGTRV